MPRPIVVPSANLAGTAPHGIISYTLSPGEAWVCQALTVGCDAAHSGGHHGIFAQFLANDGGLIWRAMIGWQDSATSVVTYSLANGGFNTLGTEYYFLNPAIKPSDEDWPFERAERLPVIELTYGCQVQVYGSNPAFTTPDNAIFTNLHLWVEDTGSDQGASDAPVTDPIWLPVPVEAPVLL